MSHNQLKKKNSYCGKENMYMDDHFYDIMMDYAECDIIPRFQSEYKEYKKMRLCPSYAEMQDLCTALNAVAKYAGYSKVTPSSFVNDL